MKNLLSLSFALMMFSAHAQFTTKMDSLDKDLKNHACEPEIRSLLTKFNVLGKWQKYLGGEGDSFFYRSPTKTIAAWVTVGSLESDIVTVEKDTPLESVIVSFDKKCAFTSKMMTHKLPELKGFTDQNLIKLVEQNAGGIIYGWSPAMPLSIGGIEIWEKIAAHHNLKLTVLVDNDASEADVKATMERHKIKAEYGRRMQSSDLASRRMPQHYPSFIFYKNGQIMEFVQYGINTEEKYEAKIKTFF